MSEPEPALESIAERRSIELMRVLDGLLADTPFQWEYDKLEWVAANIRTEMRAAIQEYVCHIAAWLSRNGGVNGTAHANALQERAGNEELV
jgi:hypothetical protein